MDGRRDAARAPAPRKAAEERAHEEAAWAWIRDTDLLEGVGNKQVELEIADLVLGAFLLYEKMGPEGDVKAWRRPYIKVGSSFLFESDGKEKQTPWGVLLREAVRLAREQRASG